MKKRIIFFGFLFCISGIFGQTPIKLSEISMINLGDGRLYATQGDDKDKPIDGKQRIITGYTTEYIDAQFDKGYATGKWEYYKNNVLAEVRHYTEGWLNGETIEYHADGKTVKRRAVMKNGTPDGTLEDYSHDGKKTYEKGVKNGVDEGYERRYDEKDGIVLSEIFYKDGKADGKSFAITNRGSSSETLTTTYYKNGLRDGEYLAVYADGSVRTKGAYKNGEKDGLWESFKRDGKRDGASEEYANGKPAKRTTYYTDGSVEKETHLDADGKKHGAEKEWAYDGGYLKREQNFVHGKQVGKQMRYISSSYSYIEHSVYDENGLKEGEFSESWEESGAMKTKGQYAKDKKHGKWLYGDRNGKTPPDEEVYENGIRKSRKTYETNTVHGNYFVLRHFNDRDQEDGEYLETWEKGGKTKVKGAYKHGRRDGTWTEYDDKGNPLSETVYENGTYVSKKDFKK